MPERIRLSGNTFVLALLLLALAGLLWTPQDPMAQVFREHALAGPSLDNLLGVDGLGRDFASRLWQGAGHSVILSVAATLLTCCLSALVVYLEQTTPGWISRMIRTSVGLGVALPVIFIGLLLLVFLPPSPWALVLAVGLGNLALATRQLRIFWLGVRKALYVQASEVLGSRGWRLFRTAIWPNLKPDMAALGRLLFAMSALELSGLAFLGLIGDPDFTELGSIMKQNQSYIFQAPMLVILPGALLSLILLSVHLSQSER